MGSTGCTSFAAITTTSPTCSIARQTRPVSGTTFARGYSPPTRWSTTSSCSAASTGVWRPSGRRRGLSASWRRRVPDGPFKVLYVSHNHAAVRPGGIELCVQDLYDAAKASNAFEPVLLARIGPPYSRVTRDQTDTPFRLVGSDPNQYLFYTKVQPDLSNYDALLERTAYMDDQPS